MTTRRLNASTGGIYAVTSTVSVSVSLGVGVPADLVNDGEGDGVIDPDRPPSEGDVVTVTVTHVAVADMVPLLDNDGVGLLLKVIEGDSVPAIGDMEELQLALEPSVGVCIEGDSVAPDLDIEGVKLVLREGVSVMEPNVVPAVQEPSADEDDDAVPLDKILVTDVESVFERAAREAEGVPDGPLPDRENVDDVSIREMVCELETFSDSDG